jgi:hypothetical protein
MSRGRQDITAGYGGSQSRSELSPPSFTGEGLGFCPLPAASQPSVPTEGQPVSNARLCAELQGLTLAIRMFGLDAINDGRVTVNSPPQSSDQSGAR